MKNQLSNMLLAGVIASTFLMVNCQKAPSKAVKADQANQKNTPAVAVFVACEGASAALNKRASDLAALKTAYMPAEAILFKDGVPVKDAKIDAATEQSLKNGKEALEASQKAVDAAIGALKGPKGDQATGCTLTIPASEGKPEKKEDQDLVTLQLETKALIARVDVALDNVAGKESEDKKVETETPVVNDDSMEEAAKKAQADAEAKAKAAKNVSDDGSKASDDGSKASDDGSKASDDGSKASDDGSKASDDPTPAEQL